MKLSQNIIELYDKLTSWEHEVICDSGITVQQIHTIEVIGDHQQIRMKDLADKLGIVMGTLTVMVHRLQRLGLVNRSKDESDKRSFIVTLTEKGNQIFKEHEEKHELLIEEITSSLSDQEEEEFNRILEKMLKKF